jgi:hypothetical protein
MIKKDNVGGGVKGSFNKQELLDEMIKTPWGIGRIYEISGSGSDEHLKIDIKGKTYIMNMGEIDKEDIVYAKGGGVGVGALLNQRKELLEELIDSDIIDEEHGYYDDVKGAIESNNSEQMREIIDELLSSGFIYKDDWDYKLARKLSKEGKKFDLGGEMGKFAEGSTQMLKVELANNLREQQGMNKMMLENDMPKAYVGGAMKLQARAEDLVKELKHRGVNIDSILYKDYNKYRTGGSIENQYKGKTPKEVWGEWNIEQKSHFLKDHFLNNTDYSKDKIEQLREAKYLNWDDLPRLAQMEIERHIFMGQYAVGGEVGNQVSFKGDYGTPRSGIVKEKRGSSYIVATDNGDRLVESYEVISFSDAPMEKKKRFGFFEGGGEVDGVSFSRVKSSFKNNLEIFNGEVVTIEANKFKIEGDKLYRKTPTEDWHIWRIIKGEQFAKGGWVLYDEDDERLIKVYETESEARKNLNEYGGNANIVEKSVWEGEKYEGGGEIQSKIDKLQSVVNSKMLPEGVKDKARKQIAELEKELHEGRKDKGEWTTEALESELNYYKNLLRNIDKPLYKDYNKKKVEQIISELEDKLHESKETKAEEKEEHEEGGSEYKEKVGVSKIKILWAEGDNSKFDKFPKDYSSWALANKAIIPVYKDTIGDEGYNKVKFSVIFKDGETYDGRLDVSEREDNPIKSNNVIGQHIKDYLDYMSSEKSVSSEDDKKEIKEWLEKYDLGLSGGSEAKKPKFKIGDVVGLDLDEATPKMITSFKTNRKGEIIYSGYYIPFPDQKWNYEESEIVLLKAPSKPTTRKAPVKAKEKAKKFKVGETVSIIDHPKSDKTNFYKVVGHQDWNDNYGWETTIEKADEKVTMFENLLEKSVAPKADHKKLVAKLKAKKGDLPKSKFEKGDKVGVSGDNEVYEIKDKSYRNDIEGELTWVYYLPEYSSVLVSEKNLKVVPKPKAEVKKDLPKIKVGDTIKVYATNGDLIIDEVFKNDKGEVSYRGKYIANDNLKSYHSSKKTYEYILNEQDTIVKPKADHKKLVAKLKAKKGATPSNEPSKGHKRSESSDRKREALPLGKRISADGNTYYENRLNRADMNKEDKFKEGGEVKSSGWGLKFLKW